MEDPEFSASWGAFRASGYRARMAAARPAVAGGGGGIV